MMFWGCHGVLCPGNQQGVTYSCHFRISLKVCLGGASSPLLFDDSIEIPFVHEYFLGSFYSHRFSCDLLKALSASCPSSFPSFTPLSHPPYLLLLLYFLSCMSITIYCISPSLGDPLLPLPSILTSVIVHIVAHISKA